MGGVENKEEFKISSTDLLQWLESCKNKGEIRRRNAQLLETFLLTKIMPHKERWFFPGRSQRRTFNEKSTSPLECLNKVLKSGSGITHRLQQGHIRRDCTQDTQADVRMKENMLRACELARGRSLFSRSPTANEVTPLSESHIWQVACHGNGKGRQHCLHLSRICVYFSCRGSSQKMRKDQKCKRMSTQQKAKIQRDTHTSAAGGVTCHRN